MPSRMRSLVLFVLCLIVLAPPSARAWQTAIAGTGKSPDGEFAGVLALDGNHDVVAGGFILNKGDGDPNEVFAVAKISGATGGVIWRKEQPGDSTDDVTGLALTANGDAVAGGQLGDNFVVLRHASADGGELSRYDAGEGFVHDLVLDGNENAIAGGAIFRPVFNYNMYIAKVAPNGTEVWKAEIDGTKNGGNREEIYAVAVDGEGNVVAVGTIEDTDRSLFFVVKLNGANGNEIWRKRIPGVGTSIFGGDGFAVAVASNNDVIVGGRVDADFSDRPIVLRLAKANGDEIWRYEFPSSGTAYVQRIIVDHAGNVIAGGTRRDATLGKPGFVVKLNPNTGALVWETLLHGDSVPDKGFLALVTGLASNSNGDLAATMRFDSKKGPLFAVFKLAGTNGKEIFRQVFSKKLGIARAVVFDGPDTIIASGATAYHWLVTKIAAPTAGKGLTYKDDAAKPGKRALQVDAADPGFVFGASGGPGDPVTNGATLVLKNPTTLETDTINLPAANWVDLGAKGFKYVDKELTAGPCGSVVVKAGAWSAKCKGTQLTFSLDEPTQGSLGATLNLGSIPSCVLFGGTVKKDLPAGAKAGIFQGKSAPAPAACP